jgi:hypothetical protein
MRRALNDAAISGLALVVLLLALVSVDDRVRGRVGAILGMRPNSAELVGAGKEVSGVVAVVFDAVKDQSVAHAPLVIFAMVAMVLVLFMLRT